MAVKRPFNMTETEFDLYAAKHLVWKAENAKKRGIEFSLTHTGMKNLLGAKRCYYTGIPLTKSTGKEAELQLSDFTIDRIDGSKGYTSGNVVACCYGANQMKSQFEGLGINGLKAVRNVFDKAIKRMQGVEK
ncbi:putative anti-sigma factor [Pseudomonas phage vB_PsyM_KIL3b]|uniref:Putative anti-sigma factor n=4 Tax=Pseudomonas phage vB_PsyM_KIL1 TaxID=1777065 RepID=A0A142IE92_9CAUD|nr:HNH endonuclease [Pseudomonas phage vB_PsyM_KIL1]AMR57386.1 putative anti-sigma factor [Pseudomonas phage vB_PsyM_KIL1]AMR57547.1 putative anti-sigma factor [Pseudomonas phage vB_PsyM_KIL2]AMR57707.1 putative anti-sigma factor [Pseudomonas phage vB_PsyM_KIL3]AMR58205.1 putative anti-sigma factor [Pseudomonas phage vB_PsyM_KIL3b]